jgi:hypothetical protein
MFLLRRAVLITHRSDHSGGHSTEAAGDEADAHER